MAAESSSAAAEKLHKWAIQELNLVSEGSLLDVPSVECFNSVTEGKHRKIWTYVVNHVRSQATVDKIKRTLYLKKLLKEKEKKIVEVDANVAKFQAAVSKITEKRMFLTRSLSTIEERILNLEQVIENVAEETNQINHKAALLELVKKKYKDKDGLLKILSEKISFHMNYLRTYKSSVMFIDPSDMSLGYRFLYDKINNGSCFKVKDLFNSVLTIVRMEMGVELKTEGAHAILLENIQNQSCDLKENGFRLTDLVAFLKCMSDSDMQKFYSFSCESVSIKEFMKRSCQEDSAQKLLSQKKYNSVQDALCSVKNKKIINQLLLDKNLAFKNKSENLKNEVEGIDFEIKITFLEKLAENESLNISNKYLEESLKNLSCKMEALKQNCKNCSQDEVNSLVEKFYKKASLALFLIDSAQDVFEKILDDLNNFKNFSLNEIFVTQLFPLQNQVEEIKTSLILDRKLMWDFCEKTNMIEPFNSKPYKIDYPLSSEVRRLLMIQPFENVGAICRKLTNFKEVLKSEAMVFSESHMQCNTVNTNEIYLKILIALEKIKILIEKGTVLINDGFPCCNKNKTLIQEWWKQNAQFIPPIEYEGKTLKMWIDIIGVLNEFEPSNS